MGSSSEEPIFGNHHLQDLNVRQRTVYQERLKQFQSYLRTRGKEPKKDIGYPENTASVKVSQFQRLVELVCESF